MIDLVLYCVCVCVGGGGWWWWWGGGGANLEQEAFQYFSGAELNKKWAFSPAPYGPIFAWPCKGRITIWFNFISYKFTKFAQSTLM